MADAADAGAHVDVDAAARAVGQSRDSLLKAITFSAERGASNALPGPEETDRAYQNAGALEPPYNPSTLVALFEHSSALRQNVDAYVTNIEAFGHHFEPVVDLEAADANERIASYLTARSSAAQPDTIADPTEQVTAPSLDDVDAAKAELKERMREEKNQLVRFFEFCCTEISFATLRRRTRQDIEVMGNGFWEVIRDGAGQVCQFDYVPAFTVRLLPLDKVPLEVEMLTKTNEFDYEKVKITRRFRRYIQIFETRVVYFKELGDPRIISAKTGAIFDSLETLKRHDSSDAPATELIHFKVHSTRSSYGVPRWIGTLLAVLGSRQAEEVNYMYFDNKSVPPLALLVSGGRISGDTVTRIQDFINNEIKGKANFHKLLVVEAESPQQQPGMPDNGRIKIDLKPLTQAQQQDALFQNYDERNVDKVGMSFRLPRMLRGDIRDFNRSTAEAAIEFAESQVFGPERDEFDFTVNRKLLQAVFGIRFWSFKSNAPATRNAKDLSTMITEQTTAGVLTPGEARDLSQGVFNRELKKVDAPWARQPMPVTLAGLAGPLDDVSMPGGAAGLPGAQGTAPATGAGAPPPGAPETLAGAPAPALPSLPAPGSGDALVTLTDMASVVTVNEARARANPPLGPLLRQDKTEDPDGYLTVTEFKAKRSAKGEAQGEAQGDAAPVKQSAPSRGALMDQALQLLALQKQLQAAEADAVEADLVAGAG